MRPVLVAEQSSARSSSAQALDGPAGDVLARWAGYASRDRLLEVVDAANLLPAGERWSVAAARERAANLAPILRDRRVLLLGRRVAAAFGVAPPDRSLVGFEASVDAPLLRECQDARLAPHPSGAEVDQGRRGDPRRPPPAGEARGRRRRDGRLHRAGDRRAES